MTIFSEYTRRTTDLVFAVIFLAGLGFSGEVRAQNVGPEILEKWIDPIQNLCLVSVNTTAGVNAGLVANIKKFVLQATAAVGYEKTELRGTLEKIVTDISHSEHNAMRACMENYFINLRDVLFSNPEKPLAIVMDGHGIAYEAHKPKNNRQVLDEVLPELSGEPRINVVQKDIFSNWYDPQWIVDQKPDLVIFHWSAFEETKTDPKTGGVKCNPASKNNRCAGAIVDLIRQVWKDASTTRKPRFIIYSRTPGICENNFRVGLKKLFDGEPQFNETVGLISMSKLARGANFRNRYARRDLGALTRHLLGRPNTLRLNRQQGLCLLGRTK